MTGQRPPFLRRTFIVDRKLQLGLMARSLVYTAFLLAVVSVGLFAPLIARLQLADPESSSYADTANAMLYFHARFWPIATLCLVVAALGSVQLSHRIAGPLVRLKRHMSWLSEGMLPKALTTRRSDFLKDEVALLNGLTDSLARRFEGMQDAGRSLERALVACESRARAMHDETLLVALARVRREAEGLRGRIDSVQRMDGAAAVSGSPAAEPVAPHESHARR